MVNAVALWNTCYLDAVTRSARAGVSVKPEDVEGFSPLRGVFDRYAGPFPPVPAVTQRPSSAARTRSAYARQTPVP